MIALERFQEGLERKVFRELYRVISLFEKLGKAFYPHYPSAWNRQKELKV